MEKKIPADIKIMGTIFTFGFIFYTFIKLLLVSLLIGGLFSRSFYEIYSYFSSPFTQNWTRSVINMILTVFYFFIGYNVLNLKLWAYKILRIIAVSSIMIGVFTLLPFNSFSFISFSSIDKFANIAWGSIFLYFFSDPKVKEQFK